MVPVDGEPARHPSQGQDAEQQEGANVEHGICLVPKVTRNYIVD